MEKQAESKIQEYVALYAFYIGITLELLYVIYDKSSLTVGSEGILFRITFLFFAVKLAMTKYSLKEWIWIIALGVVGFISYRCSSRNDMLRLVVMCAAFKGVDYKKVMNYTFYVMLTGCTLILLLAVFGILGDMSVTAVYRAEEETRYVLGFGHPNQMHCMFWVVSTLGVYCFFERITPVWLFGLMAVNTVLFFLTDSKGGFLGMTLTVLAAFVLKYTKKLRDRKWLYVAVAVCIVLAGAMAVAIAYYGKIYHDDPDIWWRSYHKVLWEIDDKFLTHRMWNCYGLKQLEIRNFRLFSRPENVDYVDMGFYKLFFWYGYIPGTLYLLANCLLVRYAYRHKDYSLLMMVASFNAYTVLEAHLISDYLGRNYLFFVMGGVWREILCGKDDGRAAGWWEIPGCIVRYVRRLT